MLYRSIDQYRADKQGEKEEDGEEERGRGRINSDQLKNIQWTHITCCISIRSAGNLHSNNHNHNLHLLPRLPLHYFHRTKLMSAQREWKRREEKGDKVNRENYDTQWTKEIGECSKSYFSLISLLKSIS